MPSGADRRATRGESGEGEEEGTEDGGSEDATEAESGMGDGCFVSPSSPTVRAAVERLGLTSGIGSSTTMAVSLSVMMRRGGSHVDEDMLGTMQGWPQS